MSNFWGEFFLCSGAQKRFDAWKKWIYLHKTFVTMYSIPYTRQTHNWSSDFDILIDVLNHTLFYLWNSLVHFCEFSFYSRPYIALKKKWVKKDDVVFQYIKVTSGVYEGLYLTLCMDFNVIWYITNNIPRLIRPVKIRIKIITLFWCLFLHL